MPGCVAVASPDPLWPSNCFGLSTLHRGVLECFDHSTYLGPRAAVCVGHRSSSILFSTSSRYFCHLSSLSTCSVLTSAFVSPDFRFPSLQDQRVFGEFCFAHREGHQSCCRRETAIHWLPRWCLVPSCDVSNTGPRQFHDTLRLARAIALRRLLPHKIVAFNLGTLLLLPLPSSCLPLTLSKQHTICGRLRRRPSTSFLRLGCPVLAGCDSSPSRDYFLLLYAGVDLPNPGFYVFDITEQGRRLHTDHHSISLGPR